MILSPHPLLLLSDLEFNTLAAKKKKKLRNSILSISRFLIFILIYINRL